MECVIQDRMNKVCRRAGVLVLIVMSVFVHATCMNCLAAEGGGVEFYKMISTLEYTGDGQFRNQAENSYSVTKEVFANDRVRYAFVMNDPNMQAGKKSSSDFSFVIDKSTGLMSAAGRDLAFWAQVHNATVKTLDKVTKDYIGKTWKQTVDLSTVSSSPLNEVSFTLTAISVSTKAFGNMIAVRSLSEPFFVTVDKSPLRCRINSVYLFDADIEDVYLSISVFEGTTDIKGVQQTLRHEVATYRTDSSGRPYDLSDVGKDFEALVSRVGLRKDSLQITKETVLPKWANTKGVSIAQVANICSAAVCEGALNPVGVVSMPMARTVGSQVSGAGSVGGGGSVLSWLVNGIGWNVPTGIGVGLLTWGIIEVAEDDDGHHYYASP